jgi:PTH1 family peptidyl-tRNA hydrolase
MSTYLIAGLGNIGDEYRQTRHNIGFDVLDHFVSKQSGMFATGRLADIATVRIKGRKVVCIKPNTFMNLSGKAVKYWMDKEHVPIEHLLVIIDEIALPLSKLRLKTSGSDGGHNGLKSVQESLGTNAYARLRFGIGNDYPKGGQVDFVLGRWDQQEAPVVQAKIGKCAELIESFIFSGPARTMTSFNNLDFTP